MTVKASDLAGNFSQEEATLVIPPAGDIPDEGTIVQPLVEADDPPLETTFALPPEEPKAVPEPVESVFGGTSLALINEAWQANSLAAAPPLAEPPGILWGAGALAAMAAMTAYYQQKRREEEEAQRAAVHAQFAAEQAEKERQKKAQAKVMAKLEKQWAEEKFKEQAFEAWKAEDERKKNAAAALLEKAKDTAAYYSAQAAAWLGIDKYIEKPKMPTNVSAEVQQAFQQGGSAAQGWIAKNEAKLQAEQQAKLEKQQRDSQAKDTAASYSSQAAAWLGIDKYIRKPEAPICGPEDIQQEKPWWRTVGDWIAPKAEHMIDGIIAAKSALELRHLNFKPLDSGLVSVSASRLPKGTRDNFFENVVQQNKFNLSPGAMKPQTVATRVKDGLIKSAKSSWVTAGLFSLGVNMYEYGKDATSLEDLSDKTLENRKFWVSSAVDTALAVVVGIAAAAVATAAVAAVATALAVTAPVTVTIIVAALLAIIAGVILDAVGVPDFMKDGTNAVMDQLGL